MKDYITKEEIEAYKEKKKEIKKLGLKTVDYIAAMVCGALIGKGILIPLSRPEFFSDTSKYFGINEMVAGIAVLFTALGGLGAYFSLKHARQADEKIRKLEKEIAEMGLTELELK